MSVLQLSGVGVAVRLRIALSCATRAASCRNMAAIIFCVIAWLWISRGHGCRRNQRRRTRCRIR